MTYLGHVSGERARQVWAAADAFVLPSYSEGFSMAVLEALACRLPCLITTACHFPELAAAGGADRRRADRRRRHPGPARPARARTREERAELGRNGRRLVERDYTWDRQADRLAAIYEWLTGGGSPPDCVERRSGTGFWFGRPRFRFNRDCPMRPGSDQGNTWRRKALGHFGDKVLLGHRLRPERRRYRSRKVLP